MRVLDDVCEMLEDEIKQIAKKDDITPSELDSVYKAVDIIKDIKTIEAMKDASEEGYSRRPYYSYDGSYEGSYDSSYGSYDGSYDNYSRRGGEGMSGARRGRDGDGDGRYSERRGRDAMGRYTSRDDGYSRHGEDVQMLKKELEEMRKKMERM